jgi:drug/metabolite transporter (DMT)-like permease
VLAAAIALGASLLWGVADFQGAIRARHVGPLVVAAFAQTAGTALLVVALVVVRDPFPGWAIWIPAAVAGLAGSVGHVAFYAALSRGPMGVIAPILAMSAAGPVLFAILWSGERPAPLQLVGLVLCVLGVVLVSRHASEGDTRHGRYGAVPLALLAIAIGTVMYVSLDMASEQSGLWGVGAQRTVSLPILLVLVAVLVYARGAGAGRPPKGAFRAIAPIGLMDTAALLMFAIATSMGELSLAVVLASLYPVVTVLLARFRLGEHLALVQRVGAVVAFAGVVAIVVG